MQDLVRADFWAARFDSELAELANGVADDEISGPAAELLSSGIETAGAAGLFDARVERAGSGALEVHDASDAAITSVAPALMQP